MMKLFMRRTTTIERMTAYDGSATLTVAGVGDGAGSREVKLDKGIWTQADVGGNSIASV